MTKRKHKPKLGRPSLGANARTNVVAVKFSDLEITAIEKAVTTENAELKRDAASGDDARPTTVSSWIRDHALDPLGLMPRSSD